MSRETAVEHPLLMDDAQAAEAILPATESGRTLSGPALKRAWRETVGGVLLLAGLVAVVGAWIGVSGTSVTGDQLSYITSGGLGGASLIAVGTIFLVAHEHSRDRTAIAGLEARLRTLEESLHGEFEHLDQVLGAKRSSART